LAREHDTVRAVEHRVSDVRALRAGGSEEYTGNDANIRQFELVPPHIFVVGLFYSVVGILVGLLLLTNQIPRFSSGVTLFLTMTTLRKKTTVLNNLTINSAKDLTMAELLTDLCKVIQRWLAR
ncbi:unnamed protein product, partial [Ectocarpus sp. 13 AM-2016]